MILPPTTVLISAFLLVQRTAPPENHAVFLTDALSNQRVVHANKSGEVLVIRSAGTALLAVVSWRNYTRILLATSNQLGTQR